MLLFGGYPGGYAAVDGASRAGYSLPPEPHRQAVRAGRWCLASLIAGFLIVLRHAPTAVVVLYALLARAIVLGAAAIAAAPALRKAIDGE